MFRRVFAAIFFSLIVLMMYAIHRTEGLQSKGRLRERPFGAQNENAIIGGETKHWKVDGVDREALLYFPLSKSSEKAPLIFAFHGHGGNSRNAERTFRVEKLWPEAIVVYMQGLPTPGALTDPIGLKNGWQKRAGDQNDRDLHFFDAVLESIKKERQIDSKRIFATGHSNGGAFTFLLWEKRGDAFAAVAPASAVASWSMGHLKPKPAIQIGGENDQLVKFANQKRIMDSVRVLNSCDSEGKLWSKSGTLTATLYSSNSGTPFVTAIYPGSHKFPEEAPAMIVKFFREQTEKKE